MYTTKISQNSKVIGKVTLELSLTDEALAKIQLIDSTKVEEVVNTFNKSITELLNNYDKTLHKFIQENEVTSLTSPTNPFAFDVCGCDCKVCKMCYRLLEGEEITAQDLKEANVNIQHIAYALTLAVSCEEITIKKAASILAYLATITS